MTTDLDTRLQMMGGALRQSVAELPPRGRRQPGRARVAVGVPLVAVAALVTTLVVRSDDPTVVANPVANLSGLIAEEPPPGFELSWAGQQSAEASGGVESEVAGVGSAASDMAAGPVDLHTYVYGDGAAAVPFEAGDLVVNVWSLADGAPAFDPAAAAAQLEGAVLSTVHGQQAVVCGVASCGAAADAAHATVHDAVNTVRWQTEDGLQAVAASRTLDAEQLVQIAEGLTLDGTDVALGDLPAGVAPLSEIGTLHDTVVAGVREVESYWVGYVDSADPTRAVDVSTVAGGADELAALVWSLGDTEVVDLRGTEAYLAAADAAAGGDASQTVELVWQEADGVLAHVKAVGLSDDEVVTFAEGLRSVADGEWQEVEETAAAAQAALQQLSDADAAGAVDAEAGATVEAGDGTAGAGVGARVTDDAIDAGARVETAIGDLEATLHADLGSAAVIGPIVDQAEEGVEALEDMGAQAAEQGVPAPGQGQDLLP